MTATPDHRAVDLDRLRNYFGKSSTYRKACGARVKQRRKDLGLTLAQVGGLVGVPFQTIHKVENGDIDARDYLKAAIALRLGVPIEELFPWPTRTDLEAVA